MKPYILFIPLLFMGYHLPASGSSDSHRKLQEHFTKTDQEMREISNYVRQLKSKAQQVIRQVQNLERENARLDQEIRRLNNLRPTSSGGYYNSGHYDRQ